jgi:hypothetical protein
MSAVRNASGVTIVKGACPHDCPDTCALEIHVRDGVAPIMPRSMVRVPLLPPIKTISYDFHATLHISRKCSVSASAE